MQAGPAPEHPTTVLLAPSWGPEAILSRYGEKLIRPLLETGFHVIVRPHPQSFISEKDLVDRLMRQFPESGQLEWNRDNDNFEVLRRSDLMISDFSGVIFDFTLIYDKPVIYTDSQIDVSLDDAWWLKETLWTTQILPVIGHQLKEENVGSLKELIEECLNDNRYSEGRERARRETWAHEGEGASRVADYLLAENMDLSAAEAEA